MNNPMSAFKGVDFDCESFSSPLHRKIISPLVEIKKCADKKTLMFFPEYGGEYLYCRPRLNKAQELDDYTPILVEGFVWNVKRYCDLSKRMKVFKSVNSDMVKQLCSNKTLQWIKFIGVEANKGLDVWAKANDVPVVTK